MNGIFHTPEEHSAKRLTVHPDGMDTVLLVADEEGAWWAVPGACRKCGDSLEPASKEVLNPTQSLRCHACGTLHGPHIDDCEQVATLVVDDEIYLLAESRPIRQG